MLVASPYERVDRLLALLANELFPTCNDFELENEFLFDGKTLESREPPGVLLLRPNSREKKPRFFGLGSVDDGVAGSRLTGGDSSFCDRGLGRLKDCERPTVTVRTFWSDPPCKMFSACLPDSWML